MQEYDWEAAMSYMSCVDLQELANGLLACKMKIDGVVVQGLLDTGAPQSIVNCALAKLLGIGKFDMNVGSECSCPCTQNACSQATQRLPTTRA